MAGSSRRGRARRGTGSIIVRGKRFPARVDLGVGADGERIRFGRRFDSRAEAQRWIDQQRERQSELVKPVANQRLDDYLRWWLASEAPKGKPGRPPLAATTLQGYRVNVEKHLIPGERPGPLRPDAQAAYDHALHQHDLNLAREHHRLDTRALQALRDAVAAAGGRTTTLDPDELQQASAQADQSRRNWRTTSVQQDRMIAQHQHQRARLTLDSLERLAADHGQARHAADRARDHARQLDLLPSAPTAQPAADLRRRKRPTTAQGRTTAGRSITSDGMAG